MSDAVGGCRSSGAGAAVCGVAAASAAGASRADNSAEHGRSSPLLGVASGGDERDWELPAADGTFRGQTEGWAESLSVILSAMRSSSPPFDGVLGFSQGAGAAAAAAAAALQEDTQRAWAPRFVWVCSGYLLAPAATIIGGGGDRGGIESPPVVQIDLPSLHVIGGGASVEGPAGGGDWQVGGAQSEALLRSFKAELAVVVCHESGHIVPAGDAAVVRYREFLGQFRGP